MPAVRNRYHLKDVHEQISLLDRKIAHLLKYEVFASETLRKNAAAKLAAKRDQLARSAEEMMQSGIAYEESSVPLSLRTPTVAASDPDPVRAQEDEKVEESDSLPASKRADALWANAALAYRRDLAGYLNKKRKHA